MIPLDILFSQEGQIGLKPSTTTTDQFRQIRGDVLLMNANNEPLSPTEARRLALLVIQSARFPFLATVDGNQPRLRPVSPLRSDGFTIYIASLRRYGKTGEIAGNSHVEVGYLDAHHNQVRITGVAEVVTDKVLLRNIWDANALLRQYVGTPDNPELILYRIRPSRVRYMREWALEYHEVPLDASDKPV
jgi:general stress protein 26